MRAPAALAFSIDPAPASLAVGAGAPSKGLPRWLIATPQCAIAHCGSRWVMAANVCGERGNQNEWNMASARSNSACASGLHEIARCTRPSVSAVLVLVAGDCGPGAGAGDSGA